MSDKPEKKPFSFKSLFVVDDPETETKPPVVAVPSVLVPTVTPVQQYVSQAPDAGMLAKLMEQVTNEAPPGYVEFVTQLSTLVDTLPTEDLLFRTALKLAAKEGHDAAMLKLDYEKVLRQLEAHAKQFAVDAQQQVDAKVGARQAEVSRLQQEIAKRQQELDTLNQELRTQTQAISDDTTKIEDAKRRFDSAYQAARAQVSEQQAKLSLYGKV